MPFPLIGAIASVGSAYLGYRASQNAANAQTKAADTAAKEQRRQFQQTQQLLQPSIEAGDTARDYQLGLMGLPGDISREQAMSAFETSPGYDFRLKEGLGAIDQSASARGALYSGKSQRDAMRFGQDYASNEFGNYYNRLSGLSGSGLQATGQLVSSGSGTANNLSEIALGRGNAQASGYMSGANAISGGLQNLPDLYNYYNPPKWN